MIKTILFSRLFLIKISFIFLFTSHFAYTITNPNILPQDYSIVFVYLGDKLPSYLEYSIAQARLFNKESNIFLLISASALRTHEDLFNKISQYQPIILPCEELEKSNAHQAFDAIYEKHSVNPYWKYSIDRFFCIHELMQQYQLSDVFQVECDVMVYLNLKHYLPLLHENHTQMALPFQNDYIASASFTYFSNVSAIEKFVTFIPKKQRGQMLEVDMHLLASYRNEMTYEKIEHLPTITQDFIRRSILKNQRGEVASQPWHYWNHIEDWNSIFDNDGIGSFLNSGIWTFNQAFFDPSLYKFSWEKDEGNRLIPFISHDNLKYRINTLHIASKNLNDYYSLRKPSVAIQQSAKQETVSQAKTLQATISYVKKHHHKKNASRKNRPSR
jgi:hypothetical protein